MSISVKSGSIPDLDFMFDNLWERGNDEFGEPGSEEREKARAAFKEFDREHFYTFYDGPDRVAMFGAVPVGTIHATWFLATEGFLKNAFRATLFIRRFIQQKVHEHNLDLALTSLSKHPETPHWFNILGFRLVSTEDGVNWYTYASY